MTELERELHALAADVQYPPTPDVAAVVRRRIEDVRPARAWRRTLVIAVAVFAVALAGVLAVPQARSAIARWLGIGGVTIVRVETLPAVERSGVLPDFGRRVSLDDAREVAHHDVLLPDTAEPDHVFVDTLMNGDPVTLVWGDVRTPRMLMTQFRATPLIEKYVGPETDIEGVQVDGSRGLWLSGAYHELRYVTPNGDVLDRPRLVGNVLIWQRGELTLRLEGDFTKQQALRIAASVD